LKPKVKELETSQEREWHDHLCEAMRDPTVDALAQSLFWVAYLLSEEVVAYEYVIIRQAFIEGITHYETFAG
jgi:hypothetical protein